MLGLTVFGCSKKKEEGTAQKSDPAMTPKTTEPPPKQEPPPPAPLTGAALADKYKACVDLVNAGKLDDFKKDCVADSYTGHAVAGMPEVKGADAMIAWMKDMKTAMPDWKLAPQLVIVSGRTILAVNLVTGTHTGTMKSPMGDVPATNKKVGHLMFHRLAINEQNKATDEWVYADGMTMMGQLGLLPKGARPVRPVMEKGMDGAPIVVVTADDAKEKANFDIVRKGNDAFLANKPADLMATFTDDAVEMDQSAEKDAKGKKELEKGMTTFRNGWSDVKMSNNEMWAAGDYVVQSFKFEGKNDKDIGKMKKTGKTVGIDAVEIMHFKDGKIDQIWRFMNGADFAMQMGMMPAPATKAGELKQDAKEIGKDIKEGAKDVGKDVKAGAKEVGKDVKEGAKDVKDAVKK
ncbi:MAG TPA: nuclear transport factor 2 family protein [Kofleriaceae bacterium]